jgi:glycosyltransferase involved in cell wall biosynthesis
VYYIQDHEADFYPPEDCATRHRVASTYGHANHYIVKSRWLRDLLERHYGIRAEIVPLGLDLGIFRCRRAADHLGSPPRVFAVARPGERHRGFETLVEAFRQLHARRPEVRFVLAGSAPPALVSSLPFPADLVGRLDDPQAMARLIESCDVLVDPSLFQAFGRPGLEAMACGTPSVLTTEGGINEYARHEQNCLMASPDDPVAFADAVVRLIDDRALRVRVREAGLATAARYSHVVEAEHHLALYRSWLAAARGRSGAPHAAGLGRESRPARQS